MKIKKINLVNFRNYKNESVEFHPNINILIGENGQGKTNLIEAIYICSLGKSFRTSKVQEMINFKEDFFKVYLTSEKIEGDINIEFIANKKNREIKINNNKIYNYTELMNGIHIVVFSPEDLKMVKGSPEERRKFLNKQISQIKPAYLEGIINYKKVLSQRNQILKNKEVKEELLDIWDEQLAIYGAKIMFYRKEFIEKLRETSIKIHQNITGHKEKLNIEYEPNIKLMDTLYEQETEIKNKLKENRKLDILRKTTSIGVQRDDIKIFSNDIDMRYYGSQGQQRSCVLSLKLAEINIVKELKGENCILLLDDVLSELDENRQNYLIDSLKDTQIFITSAEISENVLKKLPKGKIFTIKEGEIVRIE